ncbi:MAG: hypothetical protein ACI841_004205 [Planctomycetota bacterium]|jgi:hypothetical protein
MVLSLPSLKLIHGLCRDAFPRRRPERLGKATGKNALAAAMRGLNVRIVRSLDKLWNRTGSLLAERNHVAIVRAQARCRQALKHLINYGLSNAGHHGVQLNGPDPFSSRVDIPTPAIRHPLNT